MKYRILNTLGDSFDIEARNILNSICYIENKFTTQNDLLKIISDKHVILVGLGLKINKTIIDAANNLKVIATVTTGLDHIDVNYAISKGIQVLSLKDEKVFLNDITGTAELAIGLIISLMRYIPESFNQVKNFKWNREIFKGHVLHGKTLGIIGLGRLGKMVANYGLAFGMKILFSDPNIDQRQYPMYLKCNFEDILKQSDIVSIHVHLNDATKHLFNDQSFKLMKKNSILINTSRGLIVDEEALIKALKLKIISGYGADVISNEVDFGTSIPKDNGLIQYSLKNNNVIITPHIGGMTYESRSRTDIFMAKKILNYIVSIS